MGHRSDAAASGLSPPTSTKNMSRIIHKVNERRRRMRRLGSLASQGLGSLGDIGSVASTVVDVANDPYFNEVICRVKQLGQIERRQGVQTCAKLSSSMPSVLRPTILPLRGYVYAQQHKWIYAVAAVGLIGLPILIGVEIGKALK